MGNKVYFWGLILCIALGSVQAYQQGNIIFEAPGCNVFDQYSNRQAFEKEGLFLDVRASTGRLTNASAFATEIEGMVQSETQGPPYQAVILGKEEFYIFVRYPYQDKMYLLTMSGHASQLNDGIAEMNAIVNSVTFSEESRVVEAAWEKPLTPPEELSFFTRHPMPWGWIIFVVIIGLLVYWRVHRRRKKHRAQKD